MLTQLPRCTCVKHALVSVIASQHRAKESYTVQENSCGKCIGGGGGEGSEAAPWPARSPRAGQRKCLHTNKHMYIGSVLSGSS